MKTFPPALAIQVWLIEDNEPYRNSVARVARGVAGENAVKTFSNCEDAIEELGGAVTPEVILLDIGLPGMSGLEAIGRLKELAPSTCILMLTSFDDRDRVFQAICAGASGYLLKSCPAADIGAAIRDVVAGGAPMSPKVARAVLDQFARSNAPAKGDWGLSPREKEVLELMARGRIMKEIGTDLSMSYHTVDAHIRKIYEKLHVHTRAGAVAKAVRAGLG